MQRASDRIELMSTPSPASDNERDRAQAASQRGGVPGYRFDRAVVLSPRFREGDVAIVRC
jgi:hypothetical protein